MLDLPGVVTPEQGAAALAGGARMTWEVASFLIVGAVILAGFAWYERSRPPSQVVALVAALAALAIAGRIAFAAFPNVKPTTDIVIFAGYALGGAPGFAVGALAALVSNFWFGQGPWTPWQMAGWGLCGVLGAAAGARHAQRRPLRPRGNLRFCWHFVRGSAELLADGDLRRGPVAGGTSSLLEARAIPFEIAHVARQRGPGAGRRPGDGADAGPLPRALRMAARRGARLRPSGPAGGSAAPCAAAASLSSSSAALVALAPAAARADDSSVTRAADWLGGPAAPERRLPRHPGQRGRRGNDLLGDARPGGRRPQPARRRQRRQDARRLPPLAHRRCRRRRRHRPHDPRPRGRRGRPAQLRGAGPRRPLSRHDGADNGCYQGWPGTSAYAVLALRAAGANDAAAPTVDWLRKVQGKDGGWGNEPKSDPARPRSPAPCCKC